MSHRVLIIGGGSIGERHLRCFLRAGAAEVALCDINPDLRRRLSERYPVSGTYADLAEALQSRPNLAVVCTPANLHIAQALECARAGAHVLIEKPLSTTLEGLEELQAEVKSGGRKASVAYVYRAHPVLGAMRAAWLRGDFGQPLHVTVVSGQCFPHYRPAYRTIYYNNRATGGGAIQDALTHLVNLVEWIVGPMTRAAADAEHLRLEGVTVEDTVNVIARHGPVMVSYSLNQHQAPTETSVTIVGDAGTTRFLIHRDEWLSMREPGGEWQVQASQSIERDDLFVEQARHMMRAIESDVPVACSLEEGRQTLLANLAILASADQKRWVEVGPRP